MKEVNVFSFLEMLEMKHFDFPANAVLGCLNVNLLQNRFESLGVVVKVIALRNIILVIETDVSQNIAMAYETFTGDQELAFNIILRCQGNLYFSDSYKVLYLIHENQIEPVQIFLLTFL